MICSLRYRPLLGCLNASDASLAFKSTPIQVALIENNTYSHGISYEKSPDELGEGGKDKVGMVWYGVVWCGMVVKPCGEGRKEAVPHSN